MNWTSITEFLAGHEILLRAVGAIGIMSVVLGMANLCVWL